MPRQERYSYSPQTQAQIVDYSPVDYSAGDALALQYLGERNKAYNEAEAMPTAFSSAVGDMQFSNNDRAGVERHLQRVNDEISKEVSQKYNGDYALAKSAIAKKLMSSKGAFTIAQQNYQNEAKARELFNNLAAQGKGPTEFVQDKEGNLVRRNLTADDMFAGKSVFDEQGNIKGLPNYEIYSAGEHDKWVDEAYSKALNAATSPETISRDPKLPGYIRVAKARGMSDQDVQNYMFDKNGQLNPTGQSIVDTFLKDSPHAAREFANIKDPNLVGKYVANIIKGQTAKVSDSQFMADRSDEVMLNKLKLREYTQPSNSSAFLQTQQQASKSNPFAEAGVKFSDYYKANTIGSGSSKEVIAKQLALYNQAKDNYEKAKIKQQYEYQEPGLAKSGSQELFNAEIALKDAKLAYMKASEMHKTLNDAKTNMYNRLAAEITGDPGARYKSVGSDVKQLIRSKLNKLSDTQWSEMIDSDNTLMRTVNSAYNPLEVSVAKGVSELVNTSGFFDNKSFRLDDGTMKNHSFMSLAKELGVDKKKLEVQLKNSTPNYDRATGRYFVTVDKNGVVKSGQSGDYYDVEKSSGEYTNVVYYDLDSNTQRYSDALDKASKLATNRKTTRDNILTDRVGNMSLKIDYNGNGIFSITESDGVSKRTVGASLDQLQDYIAEINEGHLLTNYKKERK